MPLNPSQVTSPGIYGSNSVVPYLRAGEQQQLWLNQAIVAGTTTSIAVQIEWIKSGFFYVPKLVIELVFSGAAGSFEIDPQFAEYDTANNYVNSGTVINSANSNNVARWDLPANVFPRYVRLLAKTWPNAVSVTSAIIYH